MRDDEGRSPLDIALEDLYGNEGCVDVALYLMSCGYACGDEDKAKLLCAACYWGKLDVVKELVEQHKVDPKSECDNVPIKPLVLLECSLSTVQYCTTCTTHYNIVQTRECCCLLMPSYPS